jgi:hypothetical protein
VKRAVPFGDPCSKLWLFAFSAELNVVRMVTLGERKKYLCVSLTKAGER